MAETNLTHEVFVSKRQYHMLHEMSSWCVTNVGSGGYVCDKHHTWNMETMFGNTTFRFKNGQDATAFALRWI